MPPWPACGSFPTGGSNGPIALPANRIDPIERAELGVNRGIKRRQRGGLLEEDLGHHGEEFGGARRPVVAEERGLAERGLPLQRRISIQHHLRPTRVAIAPPEPGRAVRIALAL